MYALWRSRTVFIIICTSIFWLFINFVMLRYQGVHKNGKDANDEVSREIGRAGLKATKGVDNHRVSSATLREFAITENMKRLPKYNVNEDFRKLPAYTTTMANTHHNTTLAKKTHKVLKLDATTMPRNQRAPGAGGLPVLEQRLRGHEKEVEAGWERSKFNEFVSDLVSLERSLPDTRPVRCHKAKILDNLPTTSVVICFCEEAMSTLLRSVHSVINRSPPHLLKEIILVDDASTAEHLKEDLDTYISRFPQVKLLRLPEREGLIRARLRGAEIATGEVLTFLDSHIECNVGWLEPLLDRIGLNRTTVPCPSIDRINDNTFGYEPANENMRGGFNWGMKFDWVSLPPEEDNRRHQDIWSQNEIIKSPTMAGGLFSIDRRFFWELGGYDPGFQIWGAENLEISFKIWMCGGSLEILPCSRVGHVFRRANPYNFGDAPSRLTVFYRNCIRLAEVWLDEYKDIFYSLNPHVENEIANAGDVSDRKRMRKQLGCKSFKWYIDHVFPEITIPDLRAKARGEVKNRAMALCLDAMYGEKVGAYFCHGEGGQQSFTLRMDDKIMLRWFYSVCLAAGLPVKNHKGALLLTKKPCTAPDVIAWNHTKGGPFVDQKTGKCLGVVNLTPEEHLVALRPCNQQRVQDWTFQNYLIDI
ncbi:polypeptide N-acetylgalactosaminyltransferase 13-like [Branchiostoma lanceolatum]|uniref:polypeptide N-acetylgalactosaminyltransferase 13-like n=1 Tax=Branchiostoma lanceolatum TaxID=7740 RepID=UPI003455C51B